MTTSDLIILKKYSDEIETLKRTLLKGAYKNIADSVFLDILKLIVSNYSLSDNDIDNFADIFNINAEILRQAHDSFYKSNEINLLNFNFVKYIVKKSQFTRDEEVIDFILEKLRSGHSNEAIFKDLELVDLISQKYSDIIQDFVTACISGSKLRLYFNDLTEELTSSSKYSIAEVKFKDMSLVKGASKYLSDLLQAD